MWSRLDDALIDHRKIFQAAEAIGKNGGVIAVGLYAIALMYSNKHLTDGFLPLAVLRRLPHADHPVALADAMIKARLWTREKRHGIKGFMIHDFDAMNPTGEAVRARRRREADRKARERAGSNGHPSKGKRKS